MTMKEFFNAVDNLLRVRSVGDFIEWWNYISLPLQIITFLCVIGFIIFLYIFITAFFADKKYY